MNDGTVVPSSVLFHSSFLRAELDPLARHPHVIAMDIDDLAHALENAFTHAYPGREAPERDYVLRELRRLREEKSRLKGSSRGRGQRDSPIDVTAPDKSDPRLTCSTSSEICWIR